MVNAARNSFTRMFDRLGRYYESMAVRPDVGFRERNSLMRMLGRGLNKVLRNKSGKSQGPSTPQVRIIVIVLQSNFLFVFYFHNIYNLDQ